MPEETQQQVAPAAQTNQPTNSPGKAASLVKETPPEHLTGSFDISKDLDMLSGEEQTNQSGESAIQSSQAKATETRGSGGAGGAGAATDDGTVSKGVTGVAEPKGNLQGEATPKAEPSVIGEQVKPNTTTRDYTGYTPEEAGLLKQMSNPAFDYASKILKENKELQQLKSAIYLQNPEAFRLDPQYQKIAEDVDYFTAESQYWQQQLVNIKQGKEWIPLRGWDKQGKPVFDKPRTPDDLAEEDVRQRMMQASQQAAVAKSNQQQMQQTYSQRVQADNQGINQVQAQKFAWVGNPEVLKQTVPIEGMGERTLEQVKGDFLSLLPAYHRNNILADVASNMFVALQIYGSEIRKLKSANATAATKQQEQLRAEPTSTTKPANTTGVPASKYAGPAVFDMSGLPE